MISFKGNWQRSAEEADLGEGVAGGGVDCGETGGNASFCIRDDQAMSDQRLS